MNNKLKIKLSTIIVLTISFFSVTRGIQIANDNFMKNIVLIVLLLLEIFPLLKKKISKFDIIWLLMPILIILHAKNISTFEFLIILVSILARFYLINDKDSYKLLFNIFLYFSIITSIISIISLIYPKIYIELFLPLLNFNSRDEILRQLSFNNLCGLTDHYSRNAYYISFGIMILFSRLFFDNKNKVRNLILLIFEFITLMCVGKRGHFIFIIIALYFSYVISMKNFGNIIKNTLIAMLICCFLLIIICNYIPAAKHTFERFVLLENSNDISNGRINNYKKAWEIFKEHPLIGIGYGGFKERTDFVYAGVHNDYLQFLCEFGMIGFTLFIGVDFYLIFHLIKILKEDTIHNTLLIEDKSNIYICFAFQTFFLLYSFTGLPHYDFEIYTIYLILSNLQFAIHKKNGGEKYEQKANRNSNII